MTETTSVLESANLIAGDWIVGSGPIRISLNPTSGEELVRFADASEEEVSLAVEAARVATHEWAASGPLVRSQLLLEVADRLRAEADRFTSLVVSEVGKPRREAQEEVERSVAILRFHAQAGLDPTGLTIPPPTGDDFVFTERRPLGVVGLITPWNFPLAIPLWKIAPALTYGNTVVIKAAPHAGHIARELVRLFSNLPSGVMTLLQGGPEVGQALAEADLDALSFTGSNAAGADVARRALKTGVRLQAELGGKNPSVVLRDADLKLAARVIAFASMGFAGQKCTATSRVIVEHPVVSAFVERLSEQLESLVVGDPADDSTAVGPLIDVNAVSRVTGFIERSVADGGELITGGMPRDWLGNTFFAPTMVANVAPASELAQTEVFGPVLAVLSASDANDALAIANSSAYGLSAAVFTRDLAAGMKFARELQAGIVRVNGPTSGVLYNAPFGPAKSSGIGLPEQGKSAQQFFTRERTVTVG